MVQENKNGNASRGSDHRKLLVTVVVQFRGRRLEARWWWVREGVRGMEMENFSAHSSAEVWLDG